MEMSDRSSISPMQLLLLSFRADTCVSSARMPIESTSGLMSGSLTLLIHSARDFASPRLASGMHAVMTR
jgi:hypothetical protein